METDLVWGLNATIKTSGWSVMWIQVWASELTCISVTLGSPHTRSHQGWSGLRLEANIVSCRRKDLSLYLTSHCGSSSLFLLPGGYAR